MSAPAEAPRDLSGVVGVEHVAFVDLLVKVRIEGPVLAVEKRLADHVGEHYRTPGGVDIAQGCRYPREDVEHLDQRAPRPGWRHGDYAEITEPAPDGRGIAGGMSSKP